VKNWIASVIMLTTYFSTAGHVGWMKTADAAAVILGCSIAMGLVYWVGPMKLARASSGVQLGGCSSSRSPRCGFRSGRFARRSTESP